MQKSQKISKSTVLNIENEPIATSEILWKSLSLETIKGKKLLFDLSGRAEPGTMTALMGSSGAGKTTLLNSLAGRIPKNFKISGNILVNGYDRNPEMWPNIMSYVNQTFYAYETQTVEETLNFVCKIKNVENPVDKTNKLIDILGLSDLHQNYVKNLSGGERIRLSVGVELINDPQILFLDEPLSGLDSYNAINILRFLRKLADMGKTVIITIHQPSYKMMQYFNSIYLMARGKTVFHGTCDECIKFFDQIGFPLPINTNPADFFLDTISYDSSNTNSRRISDERLNHITESWKNYEKQNIDFDTKKTNLTNSLSVIKPKGNFSSLFFRNLSNCRRDISFLYIKLYQKIFLITIYSFAYWQVGTNDPLSILNFRGFFTNIVINMLFATYQPLFNKFKEGQKIIARERQAGFYSGYSAFLARFLAELVVLFIFEIPYLTVMYCMAGFNQTLFKYGQYMALLLSEIIFAVAFGLTISIFGATTSASQAIGATFGVIFVLFSSGFTNPEEQTVMARIMMNFSPLQYLIKACVQSQAEGRTFAFGKGSDEEMNSTMLLKFFGYDKISFEYNIGVIYIFIVLSLIVGSIKLHMSTKSRLLIK
ncbi:hypothetical protein NUSPORA_01362 [Nucleospora cyclopteri]